MYGREQKCVAAWGKRYRLEHLSIDERIILKCILSIDERIILKCIFKKRNRGRVNGLIWLRIGTSRRVL